MDNAGSGPIDYDPDWWHRGPRPWRTDFLGRLSLPNPPRAALARLRTNLEIYAGNYVILAWFISFFEFALIPGGSAVALASFLAWTCFILLTSDWSVDLLNRGLETLSQGQLGMDWSLSAVNNKTTGKRWCVIERTAPQKSRFNSKQSFCVTDTFLPVSVVLFLIAYWSSNPYYLYTVLNNALVNLSALILIHALFRSPTLQTLTHLRPNSREEMNDVAQDAFTQFKRWWKGT